VDVRGNEIVLGFDNPNLARTFREGFNAEPLAEAVAEVLGGKWRISVGTGTGGAGGSGGGGGAAPMGGRGAPMGGPAGQRAGYSAPAPAAPSSTPGFAPGDEAMDDVPPDDDPDADGQRGAVVSGEDAAVALLQRGLGAKVIEEIAPDS
jgi:DNA polymerase-3 subunit gamma/tau